MKIDLIFQKWSLRILTMKECRRILWILRNKTSWKSSQNLLYKQRRIRRHELRPWATQKNQHGHSWLNNIKQRVYNSLQIHEAFLTTIQLQKIMSKLSQKKRRKNLNKFLMFLLSFFCCQNCLLLTKNILNNFPLLLAQILW